MVKTDESVHTAQMNNFLSVVFNLSTQWTKENLARGYLKYAKQFRHMIHTRKMIEFAEELIEKSLFSKFTVTGLEPLVRAHLLQLTQLPAPENFKKNLQSKISKIGHIEFNDDNQVVHFEIEYKKIRGKKGDARESSLEKDSSPVIEDEEDEDDIMIIDLEEENDIIVVHEDVEVKPIFAIPKKEPYTVSDYPEYKDPHILGGLHQVKQEPDNPSKNVRDLLSWLQAFTQTLTKSSFPELLSEIEEEILMTEEYASLEVGDVVETLEFAFMNLETASNTKKEEGSILTSNFIQHLLCKVTLLKLEELSDLITKIETFERNHGDTMLRISMKNVHTILEGLFMGFKFPAVQHF